MRLSRARACEGNCKDTGQSMTHCLRGSEFCSTEVAVRLQDAAVQHLHHHCVKFIHSFIHPTTDGMSGRIDPNPMRLNPSGLDNHRICANSFYAALGSAEERGHEACSAELQLKSSIIRHFAWTQRLRPSHRKSPAFFTKHESV